MDLTHSIISAENQFKQILEGFFISVYNEKTLPSHGLEHHRRVWRTAKELVLSLAEKNIIKDPQFISSLIIASYMHDLGMVTDHGPTHGRYSHELCKKFLAQYNLMESDFPGLADAIINHDNKDYSMPDGINLRTLLSVADDLDAFGFIGIYRYIEIYSLRGVKSRELASKVRENARRRYIHFEELFGAENELIIKHAKRYHILDDFFSNYDLQLNKGERYTGYLKVAEILSDLVKNKTDLGSLAAEYEKSGDEVTEQFFGALKSELSVTSL